MAAKKARKKQEKAKKKKAAKKRAPVDYPKVKGERIAVDRHPNYDFVASGITVHIYDDYAIMSCHHEQALLIPKVADRYFPRGVWALRGVTESSGDLHAHLQRRPKQLQED